VMFGLGGVFTEALQDVVFRIAPFDEIQAEDMMEEIMSSKLLEGFRGESPADKKTINQCSAWFIKTGHGTSRYQRSRYKPAVGFSRW